MADTFALDYEPFTTSPSELDLENPINWDAPLNRGLTRWFRTTPELRGVFAFDLTNLNRNNLRHGLVKGGPVVSNIAAPGSGASWRFDGTDDWIDCGIYDTPAITICTFAYFFNFANAYSGVVIRAGQAVQLFVKSTAKLAVYLTTGGGTINYDGTGASTLVANRWYRLAITYDAVAAVGRGFINGRLDGTTGAGSGTLSSAIADKFAIGQDINNAGRFMSGLQNDVRFYGRALSQTEIALESEAAWQGFVNELNWTAPSVFVPDAGTPVTTTSNFLCLLGAGA